MKERLVRILNIKMSESRYVLDLLTVQLFIGLANALINIVAFTLFVYTFKITDLPYAFLIIAVLLLGINMVYEKLEHKYSPQQVLKIILLSSIGILLLLWSGLAVAHTDILIYALLVWSTLFYMTTGYAFWGLVSLLFNLRESKRVFSIVGAGDIPAKLVGYLAVPVLVPLIGLNNILLFSVAALVTGYVLLHRLVRKKSWEVILRKANYQQHHHAILPEPRKGRIEAFFRSELIFSISLLSILSYNVFVLMDYTFISEVKSRFYNITHLATFIAQFFAFGRIIALILKLAFSSRAIERLGIITCLSITPVVLFVFSLAFFTTDNPAYSVYIFGIMALLTEVLRSTIQEPVFLNLFQPLSEHLRLKGHIIAKGYMFPISLVVVGLSLILFPVAGIEMNIINTVKVLLVNLVVWGIIIFMIRQAYIRVLHYSIKKGVYSGEGIHMYDAETINILLSKVEGSKETEAIYALNLLESAGYTHLDELLEKQLYRPSPEVVNYALGRLDERGKLDTALLHHLLTLENVAPVREKIIAVLCRIDVQYLTDMAARLSEHDFPTRKIIVRNLLNQHEFACLLQAGREIDRLITSPLPEERALALDIISELKDIKFTDAIERLLEDPETSIRREAVIAVGKLRVQKLLPYLVRLLDDPAHKYLALHGLVQYGDHLFKDLSVLPEEEQIARTSDFIKLAGKIKGLFSTNYLITHLDHADGHAERVIHALWVKGFDAELPRHIHQFHTLLIHYLKVGVEKLYMYNEVPHLAGRPLVKSCLLSEVRNDLDTVLKICSMLYHKKEINRVMELISRSTNHKLFNAMEMLEWVLPKKVSFQVNSLIDFVIDPSVVKRPFIEYDVRGFFQKLLVTQAQSFNVWTRAVCIYTSLQNGQVGLVRQLSEQLNSREEPIIQETRNYVLQYQTAI
jgi:ATP:ADP antiporter, AAA family